jgi:cation diffusion facilitator family transporter
MRVLDGAMQDRELHRVAEFPPARTPAPNPRQKAALLSLGVGTLLLAAKFVAWLLTDSSTVLSDAMESIVNVVAAFAMFFAVRFSSQPADEDHPYGHGKIEFITSGSEGGAIAIAALLIIAESVRALVTGAKPHDIDVGVWIVGLAGAANCGLGLHLIRVGKREGSAALVGDGHHVLSDFWTSAGAVVGLLLVLATGLTWIDPVVAILVSVKLLVTGWSLLRSAARGLLDETDPEVVADLAAALEKARRPGVIEVHDLRAINVGGFRHVDLHVVVPEFWPVERAHREMDEYHVRAQSLHSRPGELQFHVDPCERAYCRGCDYAECAVRVHAFEARRAFTADSVVRGPAPAEAKAVHADPHPTPNTAAG